MTTTEPDWPHLLPDISVKGTGSVYQALYPDSATTVTEDTDGIVTAQLELWGDSVTRIGPVSEGDILTVDLGDGSKRWLVTDAGLNADDNEVHVIRLVPVQEGDD